MKATVAVTVRLDERLVKRIEAARARGIPINVSAAARAGILAELDRVEAQPAGGTDPRPRTNRRARS